MCKSIFNLCRLSIFGDICDDRFPVKVTEKYGLTKEFLYENA